MACVAWGITGAGHFLAGCAEVVAGLPDVHLFLSRAAEEVVRMYGLEARLAGGARRLYIDGGCTIQSFLVAGLIDELTVTVLPILIGAGRPLFGPLPADVHLTHAGTQVYDCGFVQLKYRVQRPQ